MRLVLAAKEAAGINDVPWQRGFGPTHPHQVQETLFIVLPCDLFLSVILQKLLRRGKFRQVEIIHATQLTHEPGKIVLLSESGQLRVVVQPYIHDALYGRAAYQVEKPLS